MFKYCVGLLVTFASSVVVASVSDISIELSGNGSAYLAPGTRRDIELVIRNAGPDATGVVFGRTTEFRIAPVADVLLVSPQSGNDCGLIYTDALMPPNQVIMWASFLPPVIPAGAEYRCRIGVIAVARGSLSYELAVSVSVNTNMGDVDLDIADNIARFTFYFSSVPLLLPAHSAIMLIFGIVLITGLRRGWV